MTLRRWLLAASVACAIVGAATLAVALACIVDAVGGIGRCELWLLGPMLALPLSLGLALIGRAAGRQPSNDPSDSQECDAREEA